MSQTHSSEGRISNNIRRKSEQRKKFAKFNDPDCFSDFFRISFDFRPSERCVWLKEKPGYMLTGRPSVRKELQPVACGVLSYSPSSFLGQTHFSEGRKSKEIRKKSEQSHRRQHAALVTALRAAAELLHMSGRKNNNFIAKMLLFSVRPSCVSHMRLGSQNPPKITQSQTFENFSKGWGRLGTGALTSHHFRPLARGEHTFSVLRE